MAVYGWKESRESISGLKFLKKAIEIVPYRNSCCVSVKFCHPPVSSSCAVFLNYSYSGPSSPTHFPHFAWNSQLSPLGSVLACQLSAVVLSSVQKQKNMTWCGYQDFVVVVLFLNITKVTSASPLWSSLLY